MAKKTEIRDKFAEHFPGLTGVKLSTRRASLGPTETPTLGLQTKGTWVYILGIDPFTREIKPITTEVRQWSDIRTFMKDNNVWSCLFESVIIEIRILDHAKQTEYSDWFLRPL